MATAPAAAEPGENPSTNINSSSGGSGGGKKMEDKSTTKRKMKTQYQLDVLERVYAEDKYPSEKVRSELIGQLNLSDRQLQMWFCHRRLKDRKVDENPNAAAPQSMPPKKQHKKSKKASAAAAAAASTSSPAMNINNNNNNNSNIPEVGGGVNSRGEVSSRIDESPEQALIRHVEDQLGEPLREDGPILGNEFYPLPPGAFDSPIGASPVTEPAGQRVMAFDSSTPATAAKPSTSSRIPREHQFIPEHPMYDATTTTMVTTKVERDKAKGNEPIFDGMSNLSLTFLPPSREVKSEDADEKPPSSAEKPVDQERPKKRKADEAKLAKELEAQGKRQKKEAEKQEALRRKKEEQEKKEQEKINKERKKELDKLMKEREKEEERQRREQKKENERKQKQAQREQQRVEKLRLKEENRRIKEEAKVKAAYERATAKKLAKLSTGLMDDEQLELMQMGAFVEGLVAGDMYGGPGFDRSKVELKKFPASVHMKKVFGIPPWNSDQNVSKFFMLWQFLTTFSDALGLWPCTVDELVQGLHDFDSRLLNEIYIALLRTLIKDVEDAAKAAASSNAASQHAISVAAGGHPQIVEAAYTWGFDIQEWGQHLNPLTWPEILRQFALAAGYGPKWKKRASEDKADVAELADGHNSNAIATLRSGAAAINAVALMRGKNAARLKTKKPQHPRLTPGTVKYAAFHVLSAEGRKGLTIMELTDRIQKSGLRDLKSSKTPEASISAALSRDTNLFERVATSTYCVRSPFRTDPDEAEDILQAAVERTYLYQTRQLDPEKDEDGEEADDEYEAEDHEMEEHHENEQHHGTGGKVILREEHHEQRHGSGGKVMLRLKQAKSESHEDKSDSHDKAKSENHDTASTSAQAESALATETAIPDTQKSENSMDQVGLLELEKKPDEDEMEIDESQVGEPWVQGLGEGEYNDLSIEERLNSLVALVDVLNEGNTIRSVLENRYDAASALKRQLWEEYQADKRWLKEEQTKAGPKAEAPDDEKHPDHADIPSTSGSNTDKSRVQMKAEIRLRAEKLYEIRSTPLGMDRRFNRYWQFSAPNDPGRARIYFESKDSHWEVIDTEEALDALLSSLDTRGIREAGLYNALTQLGGTVRKAMKALPQSRVTETSSSDGSPSSGVSGPSSETSEYTSAILIETASSPAEIEHAMDRYKDLDRWIWNLCLQKSKKNFKVFSLGKKRDVETIFSCDVCHELYWPEEEEHCSLCHTVLGYTEYAQHVCECKDKPGSKHIQLLPSRIQLLKYLLLAVEVAVPADAFKAFWTSSCRKDWCNDVRSATSSSKLLEGFTTLESAVNEDWLSSSYETTAKALATTLGVVGHAKNLPWVPETSAATALRLKTFDAAIAYNTEQRQQMEDESEDEGANAMQDPTATGDMHAGGTYEMHSSPESGCPPELQNGHLNTRGGRSRGGKGPSTRGGRVNHHHQEAGTSRVPRNRGRLSFRIESNTGRIEQQQEQQQYHQVKDDEEDSSDCVSDQESVETEHSYEEQKLQQQEQETYQGYGDDERQYRHHEEHYHDQEQGYQYQEHESDDESDEQQQLQQQHQQQGAGIAGEEYYVEEEEEEEEDDPMDDQQQQHMMMQQQQELQQQDDEMEESEDDEDDEDEDEDDESG